MRHRRFRNPIGLLAALSLGALLNCFASSNALAWGALGHKIICGIAYLELTPDTRTRVDALIGADPKSYSFPEACTWPDKFPRQRAPEHYLNVPRTVRLVEPQNLCPLADRCVASAILNDMRDLAFSSDISDQVRLLKSLSHWVGDIHQPLHVSFEDDRGGNNIWVDGLCPRNLHSVWDQCIIEKRVAVDAETAAQILRTEISEADRKEWANENIDATSVAAWADESLAISLRPSVQYCVQKDVACWYSDESLRFPARPRGVEIDDAYLQAHSPIVRDRLKRAGVRLGAILNAVLKVR
jgi:hypothetical protein